ncbi:MAG TPA: hypothetical protein VJT71_08155 [Pyrinomonadaceae bacterium]|nr:hypothetical protein [Pyrinomonadaceae bacterium]
MKKTSVFSLALCLLFIGCGTIYGPVKEAQAFADEKEDVISQMAKTLAANPTEAGVGEARKIFEAKKDSLKAKREAIKSAPQGKNNDWYNQLMRTEARHEEMLRDIGTKLSVACRECEAKWKALEKDFNEAAKYHQT